jgi:hypothetical protein
VPFGKRSHPRGQFLEWPLPTLLCDRAQAQTVLECRIQMSLLADGEDQITQDHRLAFGIISRPCQCVRK